MFVEPLFCILKERDMVQIIQQVKYKKWSFFFLIITFFGSSEILGRHLFLEKTAENSRSVDMKTKLNLPIDVVEKRSL